MNRPVPKGESCRVLLGADIAGESERERSQARGRGDLPDDQIVAESRVAHLFDGSREGAVGLRRALVTHGHRLE